MIRMFNWAVLFVLISFSSLAYADVKIGLEVLLDEQIDLIKGKNIGIVANHTAVDSHGTHIYDLLKPHANIVALFGPEHGFKGNQADGLLIQDEEIDGIPIYSLYGTYRTPTPKMLKDVDILIYDIQDVGVKFYTFISNMFLSMVAAERDGIKMIVLDRPNAIDNTRVEGAVTNPMNTSFVGIIPLPARYGMTAGELAKLLNNETYAGFVLKADLTVVPMKNYKKSMWYDETGLPWVGPSPNMSTLDTATIYPGTCLIEGTNLSEGRGTDTPFLTIGAPYINAKKWIDAIPDEVKKGVRVEAVSFIPKDIPGVAPNPKYEGKTCNGFHITITDRDAFQPIPFTVAALCAANELYPKEFSFRNSGIDRLWGNESLRGMVEAGKTYSEIMQYTEKGVEQFKSVRQKYLMYK